MGNACAHALLLLPFLCDMTWYSDARLQQHLRGTGRERGGGGGGGGEGHSLGRRVGREVGGRCDTTDMQFVAASLPSNDVLMSHGLCTVHKLW